MDSALWSDPPPRPTFDEDEVQADLARIKASLLNRPAGSGRSQPDTHYCAKCRGMRETTIIRGYNGAKDHHRCESCGRTWPR